MAEGPIDFILVIGTTARVFPAAEYVPLARARGARVVLINMDAEDLGAIGHLQQKDFLFQGDAAQILPEILKPVIGELVPAVQGNMS
jgi:NAD-dependent SIR2 family protein deacetylase